jgi:hypothetical protein
MEYVPRKQLPEQKKKSKLGFEDGTASLSQEELDYVRSMYGNVTDYSEA